MNIFQRIIWIKKCFERQVSVLNEVRISRKALLHNFDALREMYPDRDIFPVLKSNAYGHGITEVAKILTDRKVDYLVVDSYYEALQVHRVNKSRVLLIGYTLPENFSQMDFSWITPVVTDFSVLRALGDLRKTIHIHIKIDTGMHRQGIALSEITDAIAYLHSHPQLHLEGVCSHLADADNPADGTYSYFQSEHFARAVALFRAAGFSPQHVHLDNSAGHLKHVGSDICNASRVWLALYGISPLEASDNDFFRWDSLRPVLEFVSKIVSIKHITADSPIGYGCAFRAPWEMRVAIVPVGYYEGLPRSLSGEDFCFSCQGSELPVLGRICMNMCIVDVTNKNIHLWDEVTIFSSDPHAINSIIWASRTSRMIPYELLVRIASSIRRKVVD